MLNSLSSIQRSGANNFSSASLSLGANTVLLASANLNGVIIRTCLLLSVAGNLVDLRNSAGTGVFLAAFNGQILTYAGPGIVFPSGVGVVVQASVAGGSAYITYDVL